MTTEKTMKDKIENFLDYFEVKLNRPNKIKLRNTLEALFNSHIVEVAEDICNMLDDFELKESTMGNDTMATWKMWKQIRNAIRDKYVLAEQKAKLDRV